MLARAKHTLPENTQNWFQHYGKHFLSLWRFEKSYIYSSKGVFAVRMAKEIPSRFCDPSKHHCTEHFVQSHEIQQEANELALSQRRQ